MHHWNVVPRQEPRVAMAFCASIRQVLAGNGRVRFAGGFHGVNGAVAGHTFGRVGIAVFRGLPVDTGFELLYFLRMTLRALSGNQIFRGGEFVRVAVTRRARGFAEHGVDAGGEQLGFVRVAFSALHFDDFFGMRELFDVGVAVLAAENPVGAGRMFGRVNRNALPGIGLHSRFAVARQTFLIGGEQGRRRSQSQRQSHENQNNPSRKQFQHPSPYVVILTLSPPKGKDLLFAARSRSFASLRTTNQ